MIVQSSRVAMSSTSAHYSAATTKVTVRRWGGTGRPASSAVPAPVPGPRGGAADGGDGTARDRGPVSGDRANGRFAVLIALVERLTGEKVDVLRPEELTGRPRRGGGDGVAAVPTGAGAEITVESTSVDREAAAVSASGSVTTADGRQIDFALDVEMYRESVRSTRVRLTAGAREPKDPLALNFGVVPSLRAERSEVDLDDDGTAESVPLPGAGLAYLSLDRNGDGAITSGTELFGPASGDGFAELTALDEDGNGWIDEGDPAFTRLGLWTGNDRPLESLVERGVGAIAVSSVASPFRLATDGETLGKLRATGVWLGENGSAGAVHQMDVVT